MSEEECRRAFQASLELIKEKCGISFNTAGKMVRLKEVSAAVKIPEEIEKMALENPELTREQSISAIAESEWGRGSAREMCELVSPEFVGREKERCIERMP